MGAADELVQSMLPYRVGAVSDWVVDICASLVCASLLWTFMPRQSRPLPASLPPRPPRRGKHAPQSLDPLSCLRGPECNWNVVQHPPSYPSGTRHCHAHTATYPTKRSGS
ncbi:hypothetical protein LP420_09675 [Massilia sp. B-10]|nr:hypothetical protein LP420_09675 [Massilia sp. B-10]